MNDAATPPIIGVMPRSGARWQHGGGGGGHARRRQAAAAATTTTATATKLPTAVLLPLTPLCLGRRKSSEKRIRYLIWSESSRRN